jgi:hypothetical protein
LIFSQQPEYEENTENYPSEDQIVEQSYEEDSAYENEEATIHDKLRYVKQAFRNLREDKVK